MAFIIDKEALKSALIIFWHGDLERRNFYCRIKLSKEDRYKTISLHRADRESARAYGNRIVVWFSVFPLRVIVCRQ